MKAVSEQIEARLAFHRIDQATIDLLRESRHFIMSLLPDALEAFYAHIAEIPEIGSLFRNDARMQHAKSSQLQHWALMLEGWFDDEYVEAVTKVGETHNRIGLEPKWYIGAYNFLLAELIGGIGARPTKWWRLGRSRHDATALQKALSKVILLDTDFAIAVYIGAGERERRTLIEKLGKTLNESVGSVVTSLSAAAKDMHYAAQNLTQSAEMTMSQVGAVATATDDTSSNIHAVATAADSIAQSITQISQEVEVASAVASHAVAISGETVRRMNKLSEASRQIGVIVELINKIADQTNLLALNATIEAARAGAAGKGFSVVAQEVKTLAGQTAKATADIELRIEEVRASTEAAGAGIESIADVVQRINGIAETIATSMQQHDMATKRIASTVQQISHGTVEVSASMRDVNRATMTTTAGAAQMLTSAGDLAAQAERLKNEVANFLAHVAAA
jgi:methyl-accepting chemotaxis protein